MTNAKKKVLLVDDDGFVRMLYKKKAVHYPLEFQTAGSGTEALEILRNGTFIPDEILLDINMPDMTGVDVLRAIREENLAPHAKVFILSNTNENEFASEYAKLGIDHFLPKTNFLPSQILDLLAANKIASTPASA